MLRPLRFPVRWQSAGRRPGDGDGRGGRHGPARRGRCGAGRPEREVPRTCPEEAQTWRARREIERPADEAPRGRMAGREHGRAQEEDRSGGGASAGPTHEMRKACGSRSREPSASIVSRSEQPISTKTRCVSFGIISAPSLSVKAKCIGATRPCEVRRTAPCTGDCCCCWSRRGTRRGVAATVARSPILPSLAAAAGLQLPYGQRLPAKKPSPPAMLTNTAKIVCVGIETSTIMISSPRALTQDGVVGANLTASAGEKKKIMNSRDYFICFRRASCSEKGGQMHAVCRLNERPAANSADSSRSTPAESGSN